MNSLIKDRNFHLLNLVTLVSVMSNVLNPTFRVIADAFSVSPDQTGLLTTVYSIPLIVLSPVIGFVADRIGRKLVLGVSTLIFGLSSVLAVTADSFTTLLISEAIRGIGQPGLVIVTIVLIGDFYESKIRNRVMGINTAIMNAGLAVFPLIGGSLAAMSWKYPYAVILLAIPISFFVFLGMKEPDVEDRQTKLMPYLKEAIKCFKSKRVIVISFMSCMVYMLLNGCFLVYTSFLLEDPQLIGVVFAVMSLTSCIPSLFIEKLINAIGEERLTNITFLIFAVAFIIGAGAKTAAVAMLFSSIFGIGIGIIMPVKSIMILPLSPDNIRGAFISITNLINECGQALGPLFFGYLFVKFQLSGVFYGAAVISVIVLIITLKFLRKAR